MTSSATRPNRVRLVLTWFLLLGVVALFSLAWWLSLSQPGSRSETVQLCAGESVDGSPCGDTPATNAIENSGADAAPPTVGSAPSQVVGVGTADPENDGDDVAADPDEEEEGAPGAASPSTAPAANATSTSVPGATGGERSTTQTGPLAAPTVSRTPVPSATAAAQSGSGQSATATPTPEPTPARGALGSGDGDTTSTSTPSPSASATPSATPTVRAAITGPLPSSTQAPTSTPTRATQASPAAPSPTSTATARPSPTSTPIATATPTVQPTATPTATPTPTVTPTPTPSPSPTPSGPQPLGQPGSWQLIFQDDFDFLDTQKWETAWFSSSDYTTQVNQNGGACFHPRQVAAIAGELELRIDPNDDARCVLQDGQQAEYVAALVNTRNSFTFSYGYAEARIFLPGSGGSIDNWPAFWHTGFDWPATGEVDIAEGLSGGALCAVYHYQGPGGGHQQDKECADWLDATGWHVVAAEWSPGRISYFYDGFPVFETTTGVVADPHYLVLDYTVRANGTGTVAPATMKVDYVRVWDRTG